MPALIVNAYSGGRSIEMGRHGGACPNHSFSRSKGYHSYRRFLYYSAADIMLAPTKASKNISGDEIEHSDTPC